MKQLKNTILLLFLLLTYQYTFSQCDSSTASLAFPNGDFNTFSPNPDALGQFARADGWIDINTASTDLFYSGFTGVRNVQTSPSPDGGGWAGIYTEPNFNNYEYVGRELAMPLTSGTYELVLEVGVGEEGASGGGAQNLDIVVFGIPLAASLPTPTFQYITTVGVGAVELGRVNVDFLTENTWREYTITLTVPAGSTFESIVIGGDNITTGTPYSSSTQIFGPSEYTTLDNIRLTRNLTTDPLCASCSISAITTSDETACNDNGTVTDASDDFFTADITVDFTNAPATGMLDISGDASASVPVGSLDSAMSHTFQDVPIPADGTMKSLTATFSDDVACTFTNATAVMAPSSCEVSCDSGANGPRFLGLTAGSWAIIGGISALVCVGVFMRKRLF